MPAEAEGPTTVPPRIILAVGRLTNAAVAVEEVEMEEGEVQVRDSSEVCVKLARPHTWLRFKANKAGEKRLTDVLDTGGRERRVPEK